MTRFIRMTSLALAAASLVAALGSAEAGERTKMPWQDVITGQIQAFRDHDATVAFGYAGAKFQTTFPSAEVFFDAIVGSGYAPIMESRSHSFGAFQMTGDASVVQEVRLTGKDQALYEAIYVLDEEPGGWRVEAVVLEKSAGLGV
jgi:hypothetical protein